MTSRGARGYFSGPEGHLAQVTTTSNTVTFTTSGAGRTARVERAAGLFSDFTYDGRDFLFNAQGEIPPALHLSPAAKGTPGTPIFSDGFEDGTICAWSNVIGPVTPPQNTCPKPTTLAVTPTYSSGGRLHRLIRDNPAGPEEIFYFYFAGRPVAQMERVASTDTFKWLSTDHLGSPVAATSSTGALLWQGGFEPFGADYSNAAGANIELRLPGQWLDEAWRESSLGVEVYYNVHRWYEWQTGRYTRSDPASNPRQSKELHLYLYVAANPLGGIDPLGLVRMRVCCNDWDKRNLRDVLRQIALLQGLTAFGREDPGPLGINPWGRTECVRYDETSPGTPSTEYYNWSPGECANACLRVHEQWHRDRCRRSSLQEVLGMNDQLDEGIAYARGAGCLTDALFQDQIEVDVDPLGPDNQVANRQ